MAWAIAIELLSDATFSRGEPTAGEVDIETEHDDLGLPRFGGKSIRGILRDSWLAMAPHFPELENAAAAVFGPAADFDERSILRIGDAMLPNDVTKVVRFAIEHGGAALTPMDILRSLTDIRSQTAEDRRTGAPARATLRSTRVWSPGLVLHAPLRWLRDPAREELQCLALALLASRHAGLSRNRGRGHVKMTLVRPGSIAYSLEETRALAKGSASTIISNRAKPHSLNSDGGTASDGARVYLEYTIELTSRAILTGSGGDPNTASTLPYIPGSTMRGIVASRLDPDGQPDLFRHLVLSGDVAFLHAYPTTDGVRALPMPLSWRREKLGETIHDLLSHDVAGTRPGSQPGPTPGAFVTFSATRKNVEVRRSAQIHDQRDREMGRAWKKVTPSGEETRGAIFVYTSLDAGQRFAGFVAGAAHDVARIRELLPDGSTISVGRSRRAGYGGEGVLRWSAAPVDREIASTTGAVTGGRNFRILLASPYIGRDPLTGQYDPCALDKELLMLLDIEIVARRWKIEHTVSYNRTWRLKTPASYVVAAGSILAARAQSEIAEARLRAIADAGIGERRSEGFGRLVFLPDDVAKTVALTEAKTDGPRAATIRPAITAAGAQNVVRNMQRRILANRARASVDAAARLIVAGAEGVPSRSLLGRLLLRLLRDPRGGVAGITTMVIAELRPKALDQLDHCTLGRKAQTDAKELRPLLLELGDETSFRKLVQGDSLIERCILVDRETAGALFAEQQPELQSRLLIGVLTLLRTASRSSTTKEGAQ